MFLLDDFQAAFRNLDGLPWANHSRMAGLTAAVKCGQERRACDLYRRSDRLEGGGLPGVFRDCVYRFGPPARCPGNLQHGADLQAQVQGVAR
jgi:hypothetical protein